MRPDACLGTGSFQQLGRPLALLPHAHIRHSPWPRRLLMIHVAERKLAVTGDEHLPEGNRVTTTLCVVHTNQNVVEHVIS
jgi:hypothetical protein